MPLVLLQFVPRSIMSKVARKLNAASYNVWAPTAMIAVGVLILSLFVMAIAIMILVLQHGILSTLSIGSVFGALILSIISLHILALSEGFTRGKKLIKIEDGWWVMLHAQPEE